MQLIVCDEPIQFLYSSYLTINLSHTKKYCKDVTLKAKWLLPAVLRSFVRLPPTVHHVPETKKNKAAYAYYNILQFQRHILSVYRCQFNLIESNWKTGSFYTLFIYVLYGFSYHNSQKNLK